MELLISAAIVGIVSTIVLVRYGSFDGTVLLKGAAYEMALNLREAQVRSVSVSGESGEFSYPYGITFTPENKTYTAFRFTSITEWPRYDVTEADPDYAVDVSVVTLTRTMQVSDVCIIVGGIENCTVGRLDISFRRPEFKALFYAVNESGTPYATSTITDARIKVNSTGSNTSTFYVEVSSLGQISVKSQ